MALDDVARLGMVIVVAQGRLHAQVRHRRVANAVPALLQGDGASGLILDDGAADGEGAILAHLDGIGVLRRDDHVRHAVGGYPLLQLLLVGQRHVTAQVGQDVAVAPGHAAQQFVHVAELRAADVKRYPVPALLQVEVLHKVIAAVEAYRAVGTQSCRLLERDGLGGRQHQLAPRAVLPQAEVQGAAARLVVIDSQEEVVLARCGVVADVSKAVAPVLVVEDAHDVARVGVQLIIEIHLSADAHRVLQQVALHVLGPVGLLALHRQVEVERLCDALLVGQIDDFVVRTDAQVLAGRCCDIV